jgi:hypothetical protein
MRATAKVLVIVAMVLVQALPGRAAPVTRVAPYDFGCLNSYNNAYGDCQRPVETARQGILTSADALLVTIIFAPPFVWPGDQNRIALTGVRVSLPTKRNLSASVNYRASAAGTLFDTRLRMCIGIARPGSYVPVKESCSGIAAATTSSRTVSATALPAGQYQIIVYATANDYLYAAATMIVDAITYSIT